MGAYDLVEAREIVGVFLMWRLRYLFDINNVTTQCFIGMTDATTTNEKSNKYQSEIRK